jgi:hypothetical protein
LLVVVFLAPWFLMGAGMIAVGVRALADPRDFGDLWICLPPGVLLSGLVCYAVYSHFWRVPRRTVASFELEGGTFTYRTPQDGLQFRAMDDVRSIVEARGVRGRGLLGWWITFRSRGWVFLSSGTTNAADLVGQLRSQPDGVPV